MQDKTTQSNNSGIARLILLLSGGGARAMGVMGSSGGAAWSPHQSGRRPHARYTGSGQRSYGERIGVR